MYITFCLYDRLQEKQKHIPSLTSSNYGHHIAQRVDIPERLHVRIAHVKSEFYRRNGII